MTSAIQNIQILLRYRADPRKAVSVAKIKDGISRDGLSFSEIFKEFLSDSFLKLKAGTEPVEFQELIEKMKENSFGQQPVNP